MENAEWRMEDGQPLASKLPVPQSRWQLLVVSGYLSLVSGY